jgi:hypothetical protein
MTTNIAFGKLEKTEANVRMAEKELDDNMLGLEEGQFMEKRKTLQMLKEELHQENGLGNPHGAVTAEDTVGEQA